ncbi:MAG TPA: ion channel [Bryobacteraceae bacterium]|nr:ion channel [Bryobacteraceae bacterium]
MKTPGYDPGLTEKFAGPVRRIINPDGTFNVRRNGTTLRDFNPYLSLINMSWPRFLGTLFLAFLVLNALFAAAYYTLPPGEISPGETAGRMPRFLQDVFLSADTLTTVGYGNIAPLSVRANAIASFEALLGVLGLAVATGLLFGRVSRPSARIGFSGNVLISPYLDGSSLQFRVVNRRRNSIVELEARLLLMLVKNENGESRRTYDVLRLERDRILFLPLTWTVVHPIDEQSPLWGKTAADLARLQAEVLILLKGHDDTFNQTVFARRSYRHDEFVWGARFAPAFFAGPSGDLVLELRKVGELAGD